MATSTTDTPWADTPLAPIPTPFFATKKDDMFTSGASHMCMIHNSLFRGYNSIYQQAPYVTEVDKPAFIGYCLTWYKFLKMHADNEDVSLFPKIEELLEDNTIFVESHEEHYSFMPGLARFHNYLANLKSPSEFSGTKLLDIMATFQEPFDKHMRSEVATIAALSSHPKKPKTGSEGGKNTNKAFEAREGNNLMKSGMTDVLPFFLFNYDREFEDSIWADWPPIPGPVRWTIMSVAKALHPSWWKFAACDSQRQRRPLYAVLDWEKTYAVAEFYVLDVCNSV